MAVNQDDDVGTPQAAQAQAQPKQNQGQGNTTKSDASQQKSFRNPHSLFPRLGNRNLHSEYVAQTVTNLHETIGQLIDSNEFEFDVFALPEEANLGIMVVVVTVLNKLKRNLGVAYYTLLLEKTGSALPARIEQINSPRGPMPVEVLRTTSDRYNTSMRTIVEDFIKRTKFPQTKLVSADGTRVPSDLSPTDKGAIQNLAIASFFAAGTTLTESDPNFKDINIHEIARDAQLQLRATYSSTEEINAINEPIRSDLSLDLAAQSTTSNGILGEDQTSPLYKLNAFVDFLYYPPESQPAVFGQPQPPASQRYLPRIVLTKTESLGPMSLGFNLLGIAQATALLQRNAWMQVYLGRQGVRDIQDIGYMNIEANVENNANGFGQFVDTSAADFDDDRMIQYLSMFTRADVTPILSQDIPLFDPTTWYLSPLLAAATGNGNAERHLINVANQLTNGNFGKYFPEGSKFVINTQEHIHLGHYTDQDGKRRDLRDIDLNAVLARQGHIDPKMGERWTETFMATDVPEQLRLSDRKKIIDGIARNATYTGYGVRISYTPVALNALAQGCRDAGLDVKNVLTYTNLNGSQRHRAAFGSDMLAASGSLNTGFLNQGTTAVGTSWSGFNTTNRWN